MARLGTGSFGFGQPYGSRTADVSRVPGVGGGIARTDAVIGSTTGFNFPRGTQILSQPQPASGVQVHGSSPARAVGAASNVATTASFTPPVGAVLYALTEGDDGVSTGTTLTSTGGGLSAWTTVANAVKSTTGSNAGNSGGIANISRATVTSSVAMTVTTTVASTTTTGPVALHVLVLTGVDTSTPNGTAATGWSATNNLTTPGLTCTSTGGLLLACGSEWVSPAGTVASSDLLPSPAGTAIGSGTTMGIVSGYKAIPSPGTYTANMDGAGTGTADWLWAQVEVRPTSATTQVTATTSAAIARGQISPLASVGSGNTLTTTWATNPTAGSTVLLFAQLDLGASSITVVDNGSTPTTFTLDATVSGGKGARIYRANNITLPASGQYAVTMSWTTVGTASIGGIAYSNVAPGAPTATNTGTSTGTSVTTNSVTSAGLAFGGFSDASGLNPETITHTSGATFTEQFRTTNGSSFWPMAVVDALTTGSVAATWTLGDSVAWGASIATYAPAAGGVAWNVRAQVTGTAASSWNDRAQVTATADSAWNVNTTGTGGNITLSAGTSTEGTASATSTTVNLPTMTTGDYCIIVISVNVSGTSAITTPSGWTDILASTDSVNGSTSDHLAIFYRKWVSGDPSSVAITTASGRVAATPIKVSGADATTLVDVTSGASQLASAITVLTAPTITPTTNCVLWVVNGRNATNGLFVTPFSSPSQTKIAEASGKATTATNAGHAIMANTAATAGSASGTASATAANTTTGGIAFTFSLKPAAAGGGTTPVTATASSAWNVAAQVSQTKASAWNDAAQVSATTGSAWNVRAAVTATASSAWNDRAQVSQSTGSAWNVRSAVSQTKAAAWNVLAQASQTKAAAWNVRSAVAQTTASAWNVQGRLSATKDSAWSVRAALTASKGSAWNVASQTSQTKGSAWNVLSQRSQSAASAWNVLAQVNDTQQAAWNVVGRISQTTASAWNVRNAVSQTKAAAWNVLAQAQQTKASAWNVVGRITSTRDSAWNVAGNLTSVTSTKASAWNVVGRLTDTQQAAWNVAAQISDTQQSAWNVVARVTATAGSAWTVRASVQASAASAWSVRETRTANKASAWSVTGRVTSTVSSAWNVQSALTSVTSTKGSAWSIVGRITGSTSSAWTVRASVTATKPGAWNVLTTVATSSRASSWNVRASVQQTKASAWNARAQVSSSAPSAWTVRAVVSATRGSAWSILVPVSQTKASAWRVRAEVTALTGSAWNVFFQSADVVLDVTGPDVRSISGSLAQAVVGGSVTGTSITGTMGGTDLDGTLTQRSITGTGPEDR